MQTTRPLHSGFTLIEVTLAVAIVGVAMLAIIGLLSNAVDSSRQVSDDTLVANLADDMINWTRITPYTNVTYMPSPGTVTNHTATGIQTVTSLDANGNFSSTDSGYTNRLWAGNWLTGYGYYRFTWIPLTNPVSAYGNTDISRVLIIAEWPINPANGQPLTNSLGKVLNRRYFVSQVSNR